MESSNTLNATLFSQQKALLVLCVDKLKTTRANPEQKGKSKTKRARKMRTAHPFVPAAESAGTNDGRASVAQSWSQMHGRIPHNEPN